MINKAYNSFLLSLAVVAVIFCSACNKEAPKSAPNSHKNMAVPVSVVTIHNGSVPVGYDYPAVIAPFSETKIIPQVNGILVKHNFIEGRKVEKGSLLFEIDSTQYKMLAEEAKAKMQQAESAYSQAKKEADRALKLQGQMVLSNVVVEQILAKRDQALASYKQARAAFDAARLNVDRCQIKAPITGIISEQMLPDGSLVTGGSSVLAQISQVDKLYVNFSLSAQDYRDIKSIISHKPASNSSQLVTLDLYSNDGKKYPECAELDFTSASLDEKTGTMNARAIVKHNSDLIAGQFVRVLLTGISEPGVQIPEKALLQDSAGSYIYVIRSISLKSNMKPMQIAQRVSVKVKKQLINRDWLIDVNSNLKDGDQILVSGFVMLANVEASIKNKMPGVPVKVTHIDGNEQRNPSGSKVFG